MDLDLILRSNPDYVDRISTSSTAAIRSRSGTDWAHFFAGFELGANGRRR